MLEIMPVLQEFGWLALFCGSTYFLVKMYREGQAAQEKHKDELKLLYKESLQLSEKFWQEIQKQGEEHREEIRQQHAATLSANIDFAERLRESQLKQNNQNAELYGKWAEVIDRLDPTED